jgi:[ribosomal protein S18]-alanine N-acetyltransferase
VQVRPAIAADIPRIMQLERGIREAAHWTKEHYEALFAQSPSPRLALVIEDEKLLHAFLVGIRIAIDWEIENILVAAAMRRQGYASQLMGTFLDTARREGAKSVFLGVRESNHAARCLYEKLGFRQMGRRPQYYRNPEEDALTLRLTL